MDSVRTALRLGAENVYLIYRRSKKEMPARIEEVHHAEEEGIEFQLLTNPIDYLGDDEARVNAVDVPEDGAGRTGRVRATAPGRHKGLRVQARGGHGGRRHRERWPTRWSPPRRRGSTRTSGGTSSRTRRPGKTSKKGVFAGGDIVTGAATVILAMGAGRKAAAAMHEYLKTGAW